MKHKRFLYVALGGIISVILVSVGIHSTGPESPPPLSLSSNESRQSDCSAEAPKVKPLHKNAERKKAPETVDLPRTDSTPDQSPVSDEPSVETEDKDGTYTTGDDAMSLANGNLTLMEELAQPDPVEFDGSLPQPASDNVTSEPTGEYSDQINQEDIFAQAILDGYQPPDVDPGPESPNEQNAASTPQGESREQVMQQAIIDHAVLDGYHLPEVDLESDPPIHESSQLDPGTGESE